MLTMEGMPASLHQIVVLTASPTFQKMVGYSAEELRRFTPLDISIEEERELNRTLFSELRKGLRQNYQASAELSNRQEIEEERWWGNLGPHLCLCCSRHVCLPGYAYCIGSQHH